MMQKGKLSILISKCLVCAMFLLLIWTAFEIPTISRWYDAVSNKEQAFWPLTITLYLSVAAAIVLTVHLFLLICNIQKGLVFIPQNVKHLKWLAMSLFLIALFFGIFGIVSRPFAFAFVFLFGMIGIVMRVLKNVFEVAVGLQEEQNYTI